jgi:hypothetical protein
VIDLDNKTLYCRLVSRMIRTPRQKEISAKSMKNLFDSPDPRALESLDRELGKMQQNSRVLLTSN